ncbi:IS3 family transposase [Streptomyces sp. GD-15H]|uniref:IS3 family transposase n=1 Tax=Streptomyces sp. GD-15H TaxID=3129112 RepID=UPI0038736D9B
MPRGPSTTFRTVSPAGCWACRSRGSTSGSRSGHRVGGTPGAFGGGDRARLRVLGGTYGSPRVFIELIRVGWRVSVNTVAKLMAELGLVARVVRRRRGLTRPDRRPAAPEPEPVGQLFSRPSAEPGVKEPRSASPAPPAPRCPRRRS